MQNRATRTGGPLNPESSKSVDSEWSEMGCGISTVSPRHKLSRTRIAIIPRREARKGYLPRQRIRFGHTEMAKNRTQRTPHLVPRIVVVQ